MKKNISLSIVIPAYNVSEYLEETVLSIYNQKNIEDDINLEVIIVNDGSTDGTRYLLNQLQKNYPKLIIINQENQGLSAARNNGVQSATSDYILFLDGDDLLTRNSLQHVFNVLKDTETDCLIVDYNWYWSKKDFHKNCTYSLDAKKLISGSYNIINAVYESRQFYAWRHIFKRDIVIKHPFPVGQNYEDVSTVPLLAYECKNVYYYPLAVINYRQRDGSIMKVKNYKNIRDFSSSLARNTEFFKNSLSLDDLEKIKVSHSLTAAYIFTWVCGDTLSNKELDTARLYDEFIGNFNSSNLIPMDRLKLEMKKIDPKNWRKFHMFYNYEKAFHLAHSMKYKFNRIYCWLNKIRQFIYKT
ncbi:glycosyltransferase family 2 protein [Lonepinella sp. MS14435]|uniref:glycosyltransferase family 2 protein n=1 Tax=unclassified Lonepinella TaxID=2642006 RepID=UPI0036DCF4A3